MSTVKEKIEADQGLDAKAVKLIYSGTLQALLTWRRRFATHTDPGHRQNPQG